MTLRIDVRKMRPGGLAALLGRHADVALALVLLTVLALLVLPLPSLVLDVAIALNFSFALVLLATAIHLRSALDLAAFPSLLLLSTLFRLGLSVATTKLILLQGHAGDIITTFGDMVVGGNVVVGLVIFCVLCAVQFIVVAKGGDRVAEVGARFTLDSIPGRQMSIDADLRAGTIGREEAKQRRDVLDKGIQFHGAMDGAMKFVKGDAIIGVVIALVNILGGIIIGMVYRDMSLSDAVQLYTVLTVGDGLVSQIPSLIISITAGLIITRSEEAGSGSDDHLGRSIFTQLGMKFRPLVMAAVGTLLMACIPGFPAIPFLAIACVLLALAWGARRQGQDETGFEAVALRNLTRDGAQYSAGLLDVVEMGTAPPLAVRLGEAAVGALDPAGFDDALGEMRRRLMADTGLPFPGLSVFLEDTTDEDAYRIEINGSVIADGVLIAGQLFAVTDDATFGAPGGVDGVGAGHWVEPAAEPLFDEVERLTPDVLLARHLHAVCRQRAALLLGTQDVAFLLDRLAILFPDLVAALRETCTAPQVAALLRRLLDDGLSIRNLRGIAEAVVGIGGQARVEELAVRAVRVALRREIITALRDPATGTLPSVLLHPDLDRVLVRAIDVMPDGTTQFTLDPATMMAVSTTLRQAQARWGDGVVVLTGPLVRAHLADLVRHSGWGARVLAMDELDLEVAGLDPQGVMELDDAATASEVPDA